jgi:hypothetical protein
MMQKIEITKQVLNILVPDYSEKDLKQAVNSLWVSTRKKESGGLRLSETGVNCLIKAGIKSYKVEFEHPIQLTNQLVIWLDNFMDCPFYLTNEEIFVFSEKMAIQLVLFAGDIKQYVSIKARNSIKST